MATPGYAPAVTPKIETMIIPIAGQFTATVAEVVRFPAPFGGRLKYLSATAQASGGTTPTLDVDVQQGTTSLLDSVVSVTAGADAEATLATDASFAKDAVLTVDFTIGGTTPTWTNMTLLAIFERD